MRIPAIRGIIDRRILANYRIDPDVVSRVIPSPFVPQIHNGWAIAGICLIRLKAVRPKWFPWTIGIGSENAAHRFAVQWTNQGQTHQGVFIPRRDTNSLLNTMAGGTVFPGLHFRSDFEVEESEERVSVKMVSRDGNVRFRVAGTADSGFPDSSVFGSLQNASEFFQNGSHGYSVTNSAGHFDGLELRCRSWRVEHLRVTDLSSSWFENAQLFPSGSVHFDCALLMRGIDHEWHGLEDICCSTASLSRP